MTSVLQLSCSMEQAYLNILCIQGYVYIVEVRIIRLRQIPQVIKTNKRPVQGRTTGLLRTIKGMDDNNAFGRETGKHNERLFLQNFVTYCDLFFFSVPLINSGFVSERFLLIHSHFISALSKHFRLFLLIPLFRKEVNGLKRRGI